MDIVSLQQKLNATQIYLSKTSASDGVDQALLNRISTLETLVNDIQTNILPALDAQVQANTANISTNTANITSLTNNYSTLDARVTAVENP
jgi:hypothetical protein